MAARRPPRLRPPGDRRAGDVREPGARGPAARARPAGGAGLTATRPTLWIGGGSGAGKSTVARILGERHGLPVVGTDESLHEHAAASAGDPAVDAFARMSMDERWVDRAPGEMLATFPWFAGAAFDLLLRDLPRGPAVVEGFRLLPGLVLPFVERGDRAVWLLPTPEQRARAFTGRAAEGRAFWERTRDPARALANVLERDRLFTEVLRSSCAALRLPILDVDGRADAEAVADRVERLSGPLG